MMHIHLTHPRHGKKIAYMDKEADADKKAGWKEVTKDEFYCTTPVADGIEVSAEAAKPKRGRPPKSENILDSTEA